MTAPVVLAAGGTGGHMFPAEALGAELRARGRTIVLVTDRRGAGFARQAPFWASVDTYTVRSGTPSAGSLKPMLDLARGILEAFVLLGRLRPAAVIGFGGYPSLPTMVAALLRRLPTAVHEQNAILGRVNRLLARWVRAVALPVAIQDAKPSALARKASVTGNPVRAAVKKWRALAYPHLDATTTVRILVTGGSQGARVFSEVVPAAIAALPDTLRRRLSLVQQCRSEDLAGVESAYRAAGVAVELAPFFVDLPQRLGECHLVIARAGASSVGECACAGRPAILVPLPSAADDHQTANARSLAESGGAVVIAQPEFTPARLAENLAAMIADPARLVAMAGRARQYGIVDAETRLADLVEHLAPDVAPRTVVGGGR